ncbi:MAG: acyltransferase [Clostridia bacterium]|nr:acyltransferase [Clostridia bacterium]
MKQQLRELDFMRALAALAVIAIHVSGGYALSSRAGYTLNQVTRFAVPMFIILSGYLLFYSDAGKERVRYLEFIKKRFKKIVIPYVIWTVIYFVYSFRHKLDVLWNDKATLLNTLGKDLIYGVTWYHLYFIIIILQLYLLYPLLRSLFMKWPKCTLLLSFAVTFGTEIGVYLSQLGFLKMPRLFLPYHVIFITWIFYFVIGIYLVDRLSKWQKKLSSKSIYLGLLWLVCIVVVIIEGKAAKTFESSMRPTITLYCLASFLFFYVILHRMRETEAKWGKILDWISKQSFLIYFAHPIILSELRLRVFKGKMLPLVNGGTGMLVLLFAATAVTILLTLLLSRIPLTSFLGGVYEKKRFGWGSKTRDKALGA